MLIKLTVIFIWFTSIRTSPSCSTYRQIIQMDVISQSPPGGWLLYLTFAPGVWPCSTPSAAYYFSFFSWVWCIIWSKLRRYFRYSPPHCPCGKHEQYKVCERADLTACIHSGRSWVLHGRGSQASSHQGARYWQIRPRTLINISSQGVSLLCWITQILFFLKQILMN